MSDIEIGGNIEFGGYRWIVLDVNGERALIIAENIVDRRPLSESNSATTWEYSCIRYWLNNDFYNSLTFSDRNQIIASEIINDNNRWFESYAGQNTVDHIFLLSLEDIFQYLGGVTQGDVWNEYVGMVGVWDERNDERVAYDTNGEAHWWWLRSPGQHDNFNANISINGTIMMQGISSDNQGGGVRPAMWINLENC